MGKDGKAGELRIAGQSPVSGSWPSRTRRFRLRRPAFRSRSPIARPACPAARLGDLLEVGVVHNYTGSSATARGIEPAGKGLSVQGPFEREVASPRKLPSVGSRADAIAEVVRVPRFAEVPGGRRPTA